MEQFSLSEQPDFNASLHAMLEQEHADQERRIHEDELIDVTLLRIQDTLIRTRVPFLFSEHPSETGFNKRRYVADRLDDLDDFYPLTAEEYLAAEHNLFADAEVIVHEEEAIVRQIVTAAILQNRAIAAGEDIGNDKKVIMAHIVVLGRHEGWLYVVDTVLEGMPLNRFLEEDRGYIDEIRNQQANFGESDRGKAIVSISTILGVPPEDEADSAPAPTLSAEDISKIGLAANLTAVTKIEADSRQQAVALIDSNARELLRELGYDPQVQERVSSILINLYHSEKADA